MIKRFQSYIDKELVDLKEELVGVLMEKYQAAVDSGKGELDAYAEAISSMNDLRETYKDQMSALQFTVKEVVDKTKIVAVVSLWYYVGLLIIFLCVKFFGGPAVDWMPLYDTTGLWIIFPFGAFIYVIGLMLYMSFNGKLSKRPFFRRIAIDIIPMMVALLLFLSLGFWARMWHPSWLVFIAAPALSMFLNAFLGRCGKIGKILRMGVGGMLLLVAVQLFFMLSGIWTTSWILYVILAFFGLVGLSVVLVKKK